MRTTQMKLPTRCGSIGHRERRSPDRSGTFHAARETEFERLKNRLLKQLLSENEQPAMSSALRRAANEAAALAWLTPFPLLVLPALLEEKARAAFLQAKRQQMIRRRSRTILPASA